MCERYKECIVQHKKSQYHAIVMLINSACRSTIRLISYRDRSRIREREISYRDRSRIHEIQCK